MHKKTKSNKLIKSQFCLIFIILAMLPLFLFKGTIAWAVSPEWTGSIAASFTGGTGTEADPYLISTGEELAYFSQWVNTGTAFTGQYIKLTEDILLNAMKADGTFVSSIPKEFTSIGSNANKFRGTFDGNGKRIIGLYINKPNLDQQGLFGYAHTDSLIKNVAVSGEITGRDYVGGIVGETAGTVLMCTNSCKVTGRDIVGGIVGYAGSHSKIRNCFNSGDINGRNGVGGIVGKVDKQNIEMGNNLSVGDVTGESYVGGVAGYYDAKLPDTWNNYCLEEPATGIIVADSPDDSAVPIGDDYTWEEIIDLLNGVVEGESQNLDGNDIWTQIGGDSGDIPSIGIFVPPAHVSSARIEEGKHYTAASLGEDISAAITSDSVFTVVFNMRYAESYDLENQTLGLANDDTIVPLPANTSIIMRVDGSYYYINFAEELGEKISLSEFIKMGSTTEYYAPATPAASGDIKEYLFIFDFSKTTGNMASGTCAVELLDADGYGTGIRPTVTTEGKNTYTLTANGGNDIFTLSLAKVLAPGYDYKIDGKIYAYEFYLEKDEVAAPLPIGTKINGTVVSSTLPYTFISAVFEDTATISLDMSDCATPLTSGSYTVQIKAYVCTDIENPRNGYVLETGTVDVALTAPITYAIKASAGIRVFDSSPSAIPVEVAMQTLGSGSIKSTLQRKYGIVYVNMEEQVNHLVTLTGGSATLNIPPGSSKGTYRFVLVLYDSNDMDKAQTVVHSIIIK